MRKLAHGHYYVHYSRWFHPPLHGADVFPEKNTIVDKAFLQMAV